MTIRIWLPGQPSRTTHQSGTRHGKRGTYKTPALIGWERTLMRNLKPYIPEEPIEGPISLSMTFAFKPQKKADQDTYKITRPDTDNMIKTVKDVMTGMGFWNDDSQVAFEMVLKVWVAEPGIQIAITELPKRIGGTCDDLPLE